MLSNNLVYLVLDGACPDTRVGLWKNEKWLAYAKQETTVLNSIFQLIQKCLSEAELKLTDIDAFVYNEGPGSQLGIRLCSMAIQTWKALPEWHASRIYCYRSTDLAKLLIQKESSDEKDFTLICDYRQGRWIRCDSDKDTISLIDEDALKSISGKCYHLAQRKAWQKPPVNCHPITLDLQTRPECLQLPGLLQELSRPRIFLPEDPSYKQWTPVRHS